MALWSGSRWVVVGLLGLGCRAEARVAAVPVSLATQPVPAKEGPAPMPAGEPEARPRRVVDACVAAAGFTQAATARAEQLARDVMARSRFPGDGEGLSFMAHSLPDGTFSTTDAAARAYAKKLCPVRPAKLTDFSSVLCARLWGGVEAELELLVRKRFSSWDCALPENKQKPGARGDYELMLSATGTRVPFTLP